MKIERQNKQIKKTYSDNNVILINIDFISPKYVSRKKKVITRQGYEKYQTVIQEKDISKMLGKGEIQKGYNTWIDEVKDNIKHLEKTKAKNPKKRHLKNLTKGKKAKNGTEDYKKQTRKVPTVRKSEDSERAYHT